MPSAKPASRSPRNRAWWSISATPRSARLELLNDALDPLFDETPPDVDLFDRGISRGDTPRLWIDAIAHVAMARDKRRYRFVQDTRFGRKVLAESNDIAEIVEAVTH